MNEKNKKSLYLYAFMFTGWWFGSSDSATKPPPTSPVVAMLQVLKLKVVSLMASVAGARFFYEKLEKKQA
ncbi:MAG: hypothetical protein H6679_02120 [Epsilonproteobacteria bacterium]|nr:hypothetical protein [Campylobacterota bacterium]